MIMSEKFNLSWNDFQSNVLRSFSSLRRDTALCDVTLVTDDQKLVRAHKIVLSTCSEFFKTIFHNSLANSNNLMLYLSDLSSHDLNTILDYIYLGEAQVFQEGLDKFLTNAQKLKLEGMLKTEDLSTEVLEHEIDDFKTEQIFDSISLQVNKTKLPQKVLNQPQTSPIVHKMSLNGNMNLAELEQKIQEMTEIDGDKCICRQCGKVTSGRNRKQDLANHIETHIDGLSFSCQHCSSTFRSRNSLKSHMHHTHSNTHRILN